MSKFFKIRWREQSATSSKYFYVFSMGDRPRPPIPVHVGDFYKFAHIETLGKWYFPLKI